MRVMRQPIFSTVPSNSVERIQSPVEKGLSIWIISPPKILLSMSLAAKPMTIPPTPPKVSKLEIEKPKCWAMPNKIATITKILTSRVNRRTESLLTLLSASTK